MGGLSPSGEMWGDPRVCGEEESRDEAGLPAAVRCCDWIWVIRNGIFPFNRKTTFRAQIYKPQSEGNGLQAGL